MLFHIWTELSLDICPLLFNHSLWKEDKWLINFVWIFNRNQEKWNFIFLAPFRNLFLRNFLLKISLISNQNYFWRAYSVETHFKPFSCCMKERLLIRKIKNNNSALTAFKKGLNQWAVSLLTSCVPDVELYHLSINLERLEPEINCRNWWTRFILTLFIGKCQK